MKLLQFPGSWPGPILPSSVAPGLFLWSTRAFWSDVHQGAYAEAEPQVPAQSRMQALSSQFLPEVTGQQRGCNRVRSSDPILQTDCSLASPRVCMAAGCPDLAAGMGELPKTLPGSTTSPYLPLPRRTQCIASSPGAGQGPAPSEGLSRESPLPSCGSSRLPCQPHAAPGQTCLLRTPTAALDGSVPWCLQNCPQPRCYFS